MDRDGFWDRLAEFAIVWNAIELAFWICVAVVGTFGWLVGHYLH